MADQKPTPTSPKFDPYQAVSRRIGQVGYDNLNEVEKCYFSVWWLIAEVDNGGFDQFFFNSTGGYIPEVLAGLRMLGANDSARLLERAVALLPSATLPRDDKERRSILKGLSDDAQKQFDQLDGEFYEYPDNLRDKLESFAQANRDQFIGER